jgi:hypothetical protein
MACIISVTNVQTSVWSYRPYPGATVYVTATITASCRKGEGEEEEGAAAGGATNSELRINEPTSWFSWFLGKDVYDRPLTVTTASGQQSYSGWITDVTQVDQKTIRVNFNVSTSKNGAQSVDIRVKCRCRPTEGWINQDASVVFSV